MEENKNPDNKNVEVKSKNKKEKTSKIAPETKKMIIKRIIFVVLFLMIAIGITIYITVINMPKKEQKIVEENKNEKKEEIEEILSTEKTLDLEGTYDINDLKISEYTEKYKDLEINYYQIDGLKDESIEVKINYNLKNDIVEEIDKALEENKINKEKFYSYATIYSNFSNTISIYYDLYSYEVNGEDVTNDYRITICENYDLTTGNKLKLNDIFSKNANIGNIFAQELYNDTISVESNLEFNETDYTYKVVEYSDIEEDILKVITDYNSGNDIDFIFNEHYVYIMDYNSRIMYRDHIDDIVIYDKFLTNTTIFDGTYNNMDNLPNLTKRYECEYSILEQSENYYIDVSLFSEPLDKEEDYKNAIEAAKDIMNEDIRKIKEEASQNPSKFIILNRAYTMNPCNSYNYEANQWENISGMIDLNLISYKYETTKSLFNSEIYDKIIEILRNYPEEETGESYGYYNLFATNFFDQNGEYLPRINEGERYILLDKDGIILNDSAEDIPWETFD